MARNRKRAKERRARRPQPVASRGRERTSGAPSPLGHAAPDTEIARQAELPPDITEPELEEFEEEIQAEDAGAEDAGAEDAEAEDAGLHAFGRVGGIPGVGGEPIAEVAADAGDGPAPESEAGAVAVSAKDAAQPRPVPGNRLINFLQGSWRELQRVQWPDRQQVMQATGVVIGFVIVAGVFLGVSDWLAGHLVNFVENGHF